MEEADVRTKIQASGLRVTYPRLAILRELSRSESTPKSAAELSATLSQFPRSTIYRNLESLEKNELIKSSLIKWVRRYELGELLAPHHHHLTCTDCQKVIDFESPKLEKLLISLAKDAGFKLTNHAVEMRGTCSDCGNHNTSFGVLSYGISTMKKLRSRDKNESEAIR